MTQLNLSRAKQVTLNHFQKIQAFLWKYYGNFIFTSGVGKTPNKKLQQKYSNFKISGPILLAHLELMKLMELIIILTRASLRTINKNQFYEYAKIFDNYYGTLKKNVDDLLRKNDIIFDIDWQGTKQLSNFKNLNLIKLYLITDSKDELKKRLLNRDQNTKKEVEKRFKSFDEDVKHWNDYDYIIINKNLESCFKQIENIIFNYKNKLIKPSHKAQ